MGIFLGYVRRTGKYEEMKSFYKLLGLTVHEHQHGGPVHTEVGPIRSDFVVEVYRRSLKYSTDALMVGVDDLATTLSSLRRTGVSPHTVIEEGKVVYVKDPEGSDVMLVQL